MRDEMPKPFKVLGNGLEAFSTVEGITVSTTSFDDVQKKSARIFYNEKGDIDREESDYSIEMAHKKYFSENTHFCRYIESRRIYLYFCYVLLIGLLSVFGSIRLTIYSLVFFAFSIVTGAFNNIPEYLVNILFAIHYRDFSKFHSAEHMGAKATFKLKRAPTLSEIKKETRYDPKCSTVVTIGITLTSLVDTFILTFYSINIVRLLIWLYNSSSSGVLKLLIAFMIIISMFIIRSFITKINSSIIKLLVKEKFLRLFQAPFLAKPTDLELEIAVEAFKYQEIMDSIIRENPDDFRIKSQAIDPFEKEVVFELNNGRIYRSTLKEYLDYLKAVDTSKIVTQE